VPPAVKTALVGLIFTPDTATVLTVTVHLAVFPFVVFAVIVAFPAFMPFTMPHEETVATFLSLLDHLIDLSVVLLGDMVALSVVDLPVSMLSFVLFNAIFVGLTVFFIKTLSADICAVAACAGTIPSISHGQTDRTSKITNNAHNSFFIKEHSILYYI
jgi:hypothetical protein